MEIWLLIASAVVVAGMFVQLVSISRLRREVWMMTMAIAELGAEGRLVIQSVSGDDSP